MNKKNVVSVFVIGSKAFATIIGIVLFSVILNGCFILFSIHELKEIIRGSWSNNNLLNIIYCCLIISIFILFFPVISFIVSKKIAIGNAVHDFVKLENGAFISKFISKALTKMHESNMHISKENRVIQIKNAILNGLNSLPWILQLPMKGLLEKANLINDFDLPMRNNPNLAINSDEMTIHIAQLISKSLAEIFHSSIIKWISILSLVNGLFFIILKIIV